MRIYDDSLEEKGKKIFGSLLKMENASVIVLDEKEEIRLGTLAAGMPEFGGRNYVSSVLLGDRNAIEARLLAERISSLTGSIVLASIHVESPIGSENLTNLMKLAEKLVEKSKMK